MAKKKESPSSETGQLAQREKHTAEFPVVGVGASAGGLETFKKLLSALPHDSGLAFVLVQHLDPTHESLMTELLRKYTKMPVVEIEDGMTVQPDSVYMIPPNTYVSLAKGKLLLSDPVKYRGMRMPVDYFFRSLAEDRKERAICIILSGTGSDGTLGLKAIKEAGGMGMVEDPKSAQYDGMPRSALSTGLVDYKLPVGDMPNVLLKYIRHSYINRTEQFNFLAEAEPNHLKSILSLLRTHTDYDFQCYKKGTLARRIQRRMGLRHIEKIGEYVKLLRRDFHELKHLFKDLLISVTSFFRDPEAFEALEQDVICPLVNKKGADQPIRVWVPGCSTGEEAYSLAMILANQFSNAKAGYHGQIFATDIDEEAIEVARSGVYPASALADVPEDYVNKYFDENNGRYKVKKRLRESMVFANQNLISDPPFSSLDLISCRNVLIYLEPDIQQKLLQLFHFSLTENGYLFLGNAESIGKQSSLFKPVSKIHHIFQRIGKPPRGRSNFPVVAKQNENYLGEGPKEPQEFFPEQPVAMSEVARRALLSAFAPASVLVNRKHEILYFHGPTSKYFELPSGEPTQDLMAMAREGLRSKLRGVLQRANSEKKIVSTVAGRVIRNGEVVSVQITVRPVEGQRNEEPLFLVSFSDEGKRSTLQPKPPETKKQASEKSVEHDEAIQQLEYELQATREDLQTTIEELETSNEELKASNEEVMSMNEELQSTNEELETSREELQSLNEELSTVNSQLEDKVAELEATNNDLNNLLTSTNIATIFLDMDLRIRRFTPITKDLLNLIPGDVGRPVSDLSPRVYDPDLLPDAEKVLENLAPLEKEVYDSSGHWYIRRILPYRTSENKIDGVVVTFSDISQFKAASDQIRIRERQQAVVAQLGRAALIGTDLDSLFEQATKQLAEVLEVEFSKVLELLPKGKGFLLRAGVGWKDGLVGKAKVSSGLNSQAGFTLHSATPVIVEDLAAETRFLGPKLLIDHQVISGMSVIIEGRDSHFGVLGVHSKEKLQFTVDDVNFLQAVANVLGESISHHRAEHALKESEHRLQTIADSVPVLISYVEKDLNYRFNNRRYQDWFQCLPEDMNGKPIKEVLGEQIFSKVEPYIREVLKGEAQSYELEMEVPEGSPRHVNIQYVPHFDKNNEVIGFFTVVQDIRSMVDAKVQAAMLDTSENERKRIGQDLHDTTGQILTGLSFMAQSLIDPLREKAPHEAKTAEKMAQEIEKAVGQIRRIVRGLMPVELDEQGLRTALEELAKYIRDQYPISCTLECDQQLTLESSEITTNLYRIAQEAITNAIRHGNAKNIIVRLRKREHQLALDIRDDGVGMPKNLGPLQGKGLQIMRYRAEKIGAKFNIHSPESGGARVVCRLQLPVEN